MPASKPARRKMRIFWITLALMAQSTAISYGISMSDMHSAKEKDVYVEQRVGQTLPLAMMFRDQEDRRMELGAVIDRPTLLLFAYFRCPVACPISMAQLANLLNGVTLTPGRDYKVVTLSFDPTDDSKAAKDAKTRFARLLSSHFPASGWVFLTTQNGNDLQTVTATAGYHFAKKPGGQFAHPNTLIVVDSHGRIAAYLNGLQEHSLTPGDITAALKKVSDKR